MIGSSVDYVYQDLSFTDEVGAEILITSVQFEKALAHCAWNVKYGSYDTKCYCLASVNGKSYVCSFQFSLVQSSSTFNSSMDSIYKSDIEELLNSNKIEYSNIIVGRNRNYYEAYVSMLYIPNYSDTLISVPISDSINSFGSFTSIRYKLYTSFLGSLDYIYFGITPPSDYIRPAISGNVSDLNYSDGVFFLYELGRELGSAGEWLNALLNFEINGTPFIYYFFGSAFGLYCVWVLVKFILPT